MLGAVIILSIGVGLYIKSLIDRRSLMARQKQYAAALRDYSVALQPGKSRREVEAYLELRHQPFRHMCCVGVHRSTYADLVKVGQENAPWYCNKYNIYVAFEFDPTEGQTAILEAHDSDKLQDATLFPWLEECL